ncbi:hypothetical protein I4U23_007463 [Adineta vaga]|nr:hypothetical protein I4U23_007463 [Adineta vaga]
MFDTPSLLQQSIYYTMFLNIIIYGAIIILIIIFIRKIRRKRTKTIINAYKAREILKSPIYTRHKSNQWLINTLYIVNPFTIPSETLLKMFKNKVISTLSQWNNQTKYQELISTTETCINHRLSLLQSNGIELPLSKLVKQVTLDVFLTGILDVKVDENLLAELPDIIIDLWKHRDNKIAQRRLQELFSANKDHFSQSEFWQQLQTILSDHSNDISKITKNDFDEKVSNPLNIIVPGWETMWRLVFYSLLELLRRRNLLEELRQKLNDTSKPYHRDCSLLESILKETLRLYPPTKNIYRTNIQTGEQVCINILHIHRNETIWGSDALQFRSERFEKELNEEQKMHYLPFSISCPARHKFAYTFAGVIVAQILKQCPKLTVTDECTLPTANHLLDITRNSYNELLITV